MVARADANHEDPGGEDKVQLGLRSLVNVAADAQSEPWRIDADGRDLSSAFIAVEILNGKLIGPNVPLVPGADPGDGQLDLVLVRGRDRDALAAYARARLEGRPAAELRFETHRAREIGLNPPPGRPFRLDDELVTGWRGQLVATIETALDVVVP
jgi:diacylglycerol kinase family enzyme